MALHRHLILTESDDSCVVLGLDGADRVDGSTNGVAENTSSSSSSSGNDPRTSRLIPVTFCPISLLMKHW
jgi:hypothetical protein